MSSQLRKSSLIAEIHALDMLLAELDEDDFISRQSLQYKKNKLSQEFEKIENINLSSGRVILSFDGGPVDGSRGIDANFAAKTLEDYQDLVAKQVIAQSSQLSKSGPIPSRSLAKLSITNIFHGSFGFELEERDVSQSSLIDTPIKIAISAVDSALAAFASRDQDIFQSALAGIDRRVFLSIQSFFENMYRDSAALKIIESHRNIIIDQYDVVNARNRIAGTDVSDTDLTITGELLGLTPISRRFDLRVVEGNTLQSGRILSGQVGLKLSNDYLERLHGEARLPGQKYEADITHRIVRRVDDTVSESFTLNDLQG